MPYKIEVAPRLKRTDSFPWTLSQHVAGKNVNDPSLPYASSQLVVTNIRYASVKICVYLIAVFNIISSPRDAI